MKNNTRNPETTRFTTIKINLNTLERASSLVEQMLLDGYEYVGNFSRIGRDKLRRDFVALCRGKRYVEIFPGQRMQAI